MPLVECIVDTDGTGDYSSLNAAEAANFGATSADLVTNDEWVECECVASSSSDDTTGVEISGFTVSSSNFISVYGGENHEGDHTKGYKLDVGGGGRPLLLLTAYTTISLISVRASGYMLEPAIEWEAENIEIDRVIALCHVENAATAGARAFQQCDVSANGALLTNCIGIGEPDSVEGPPESFLGILNNPAAAGLTLLNCTAYGWQQGFQANRSAVIAKNCLAYDNSDYDFGSSGWDASSDYNASGDSSAPGTNSLHLISDPFIDADNGDFTLKSGSNAIDAGTDLSADMDSVDITGTSRPSGEWDIGAFEYVSSGGTVVTVSADLDALISKSIQQTTSADALLSKSFTLDLSVDAVLAALRSVVTDLDGVLSKQIQSTTDLDALIQKVQQNETSIDALLKQTGITTTTSIDAVLQARTEGFSSTELDALLARHGLSISAVADALLSKQFSGSVSADALLKKIVTRSLSLDGLLQVTGQTQTLSIDALLRKIGITASTSIDGLLRKSGLTSIASLDAILTEPGSGTVLASLDALLRAEGVTFSCSMDALISRQRTAQASIDSILRKSLQTTTGLDSLLISGGSISATIDALLQATGVIESTSIDALIRKTGQALTAALDAVLIESAVATVQMDALLSGQVTRSVLIDAIVGIPTALKTFTAKTQLFNFTARTQQFNFTAKEI